MPTTRSPVARSPLHHWHAAHGAHFAERDGWQVVTHYLGAAAEAAAARSGLGLADVSAFAKVSLRGPGVPDLARTLVPASAALKPHGVGVIPSGAALACRLTEGHLLLLGTTPDATDLRKQRAWPGNGRTVAQIDVASAYAGFCVVGPRLEDLLRRLTHVDIRPTSFPADWCAETALAGVEALLVRSGRPGLPSLRVYVAWDLGEYVWERILDAGRDGPVTPVGLEALGVIDG
jgi:sarcosine oxidase subunit alpha